MPDEPVVGSVDLSNIVKGVADVLDQVSSRLREFQQNFSKVAIDISANPNAVSSINDLTNLLSKLFLGVETGSAKASADLSKLGTAAKDATQKLAQPIKIDTSDIDAKIEHTKDEIQSLERELSRALDLQAEKRSPKSQLRVDIAQDSLNTTREQLASLETQRQQLLKPTVIKVETPPVNFEGIGRGIAAGRGDIATKFDAGAFLTKIETSSNQAVTRFKTLEELIENIKKDFPEMASFAQSALTAITTGAKSGSDRLEDLNGALASIGTQSGTIATKMTELRITIEGLARERNKLAAKETVTDEDEREIAKLSTKINELVGEYKELSLAKEAAARISAFGKEGKPTVEAAVKEEAHAQKIASTEAIAIINEIDAEREAAHKKEEERQKAQIALNKQRNEAELQQEREKAKAAEALNKQRNQAELQQEAFEATRPELGSQAILAAEEAEKRLTDAKRASVLATRAVQDAEKSRNPAQKAAAIRALELAEKAQAAAALAAASAEKAKNIALDPKATETAIKEANRLADAHKKAAASALQNANSSLNLAKAFQQADRPAADIHDKMLALLAVSRFLPGQLGAIVSGLGLMEGATRSAGGRLFALVGTVGALAAGFVQLGFQFNDTLNKLRSQSQGLGLTLDVTKAIQRVMEQTGHSIEELSLGLRRVNEGITGIGTSTARTRATLRIAFGDEFQIEGRQTIEVLKDIFDALNVNGEKFIGEARAGILANGIFQRTFDEVRGSAADLSEQLQKTIDLQRKTGTATKEAADAARRQAEAVKDLKERWDGVVASFKAPAVASVILKFFTGEGTEITFQEVVDTINTLLNLTTLRILTNILPKPKREEPVLPSLKQTETFFKGSGLQPKTDQGDLKTFLQTQEEQQQEEQALAASGTTAINRTTAAIEKQKGALQNQIKSEKGIAALEIQASDDLETRIAKLEIQKDLKAAEVSELKALQKEFLEAAKIPDEQQTRSQKQLGDKIKEVIQGEKELRKLEQQLADLRKTANPFAKLEERRQDLKEEIQSIDTRSEAGLKKLEELGKELLNVDKQLDALAKTPQDKTKFSKELRRDTLQIQGQIFQAQKQQLNDEINELKTSAQLAVADLEDLQKQAVESNNLALAAGLVTVKEVATQQIASLEGILDTFDRSFEARIAKIKQGISLLEQEKVTSADPNKLNIEIDNLNRQLRAEEVARVKQKSDLRNKEVQIAISAQQEIIENRQELLNIEIAIQEEVNKRKLELLARASRESIIIEEEEIRTKARLEREQNQRSLDALATRLRDQKVLAQRAALAPSAPGQGASVEAIQSLKFPEAIANLTAQRVSRIIQEIEASPLAEQSKELLSILKEILIIKQKGLNIDQQEVLLLKDNKIKQGEFLLNVKKQEIDLEQTVLDLQEQRLAFLEQEGLLRRPEAREQEIQLELERLRIIQLRIKELEKERDFTVAKKLDAITTGGRSATEAEVAFIKASPELADINQELIQLQREALASADKLDLTASALGRIRTGLDDVISALEAAPTTFDKFSTEIIKRPLTGLADAARGVQELINVILGARAQARTPAEDLKDASTTFNTQVDNAARNFKSIIEQAAESFKASLSTPSPLGSAIGGVGVLGGSVQNEFLSNKNFFGGLNLGGEAAKGLSETAKNVLSKSFTVASGVIKGLTASTIGGKIAGFGQIASAFGPVGQAVSAGLSIIGGIADFIGAGFRKKAEELAKNIQDNATKISNALRDGSITLGEATRELQAQLESARGRLTTGKTGKKGGKELFDQLQKSIGDQIADLRRQAKKIQDDFRAGLELLRQPSSLRDTIKAINDIAEKAQAFIKSFENPADALAAVKEAQEFVKLSIKDLTDSIKSSLKSLQDNLKQATEKFASDTRSILLEGRIDPRVSEAESKRRRLVELEKQFQLQKLELEKQISAEQQKLDYAKTRESIEENIARLAQQSADALSAAASSLAAAANSLDGAFSGFRNINSASSTSSGTVTLNITVNGESAGSTQIGIGQSQHLEMAGLITPSSRLPRYNPRTR